MPTNQYVITARNDEGSSNGLAPLGTREELLEQLSHFNTAPEKNGDNVLYGPGIRLELPWSDGPVTQMLMTITEDDIGWLVVVRLARRFHWKIIDPMSGRELTP